MEETVYIWKSGYGHVWFSNDRNRKGPILRFFSSDKILSSHKMSIDNYASGPYLCMEQKPANATQATQAMKAVKPTFVQRPINQDGGASRRVTLDDGEYMYMKIEPSESVSKSVVAAPVAANLKKCIALKYDSASGIYTFLHIGNSEEEKLSETINQEIKKVKNTGHSGKNISISVPMPSALGQSSNIIPQGPVPRTLANTIKNRKKSIKDEINKIKSEMGLTPNQELPPDAVINKMFSTPEQRNAAKYLQKMAKNQGKELNMKKVIDELADFSVNTALEHGLDSLLGKEGGVQKSRKMRRKHNKQSKRRTKKCIKRRRSYTR